MMVRDKIEFFRLIIVWFMTKLLSREMNGAKMLIGLDFFIITDNYLLGLMISSLDYF